MTNFIADKPVDITTLNKSRIGANLTPADRLNPPVFIDLMKNASPWQSGGMKQLELFNNGYLDNDSNILSAPPTAGEFASPVFKFWGYPYETTMSGGWTVTWDGPADGVSFRSVNQAAVSGYDTSTPNVIKFNYDASIVTTCQLVVDATKLNPSNLHRNFKIIEDKNRALYDAGQICHPGFLSENSRYSYIRLMNFSAANTNFTTEWSERVLPTSQFFTGLQIPSTPYWSTDKSESGRGCPYEIMIKICEETGATPWWCLPARANDDYFIKWAQLVDASPIRNRLGVVELGNENWNFSFSNTSYMVKRSIAEWGSQGQYSMHAKLTTLMGLAIRSIIPEKERLEITMGGWQIATNRVVDYMEAPLWLQKEPENYIAPHTVVNSYSIGGYYYAVDLPNKKDAVYAAWQQSKTDGTPTAFVNYIVSQTVDGVAKTVQQFTDWAALLKPYGVALNVYEGSNQHNLINKMEGDVRFYPDFRPEIRDANGVKTQSRFDGEPDPEFLALWLQMYKSQGIADLTDQTRTAFKNAGGRVMCLFANVGTHSKYGGWGLVEGYGEVNPNTVKLDQWIANNPLDFLPGVY